MHAHTSGDEPAGSALIIAWPGPPGPDGAAGIDEAEGGTCAEGIASSDASSLAPGAWCCGKSSSAQELCGCDNEFMAR